MVAYAASNLAGRFSMPPSTVGCNCSSNPSPSAPSCSFLFGAWATGPVASQRLETHLTTSRYLSSYRPSVHRRQDSIRESVDKGRRTGRTKECGRLRVTNSTQEIEPSVNLEKLDSQTSGNGAATNGAAKKQAVSRVEWWRIDERGGFQTSLESAEAGPSQSHGNGMVHGDSVMGPRRVGWIREAHLEEERTNEEELWTWKAATHTLHLNGTAMHGLAKTWEEETREEIVVSHGPVSGSGGSANGRGVDVSHSSVNAVSVSESSQNGASGIVVRNGVSAARGIVVQNGAAGVEVGDERSVRAENGRSFREAPGGSQPVVASKAAVSEPHSESKAGSKKKVKKDGKKVKKAPKMALETGKKKKKVKKAKKAKKEGAGPEGVAAAHTSADATPPGAFVDVNGVRMYPGPGYVDRMEGKYADVLTSLSEAVKPAKKAEKAGAVLAQPPQNGAAKTEPPAENLEQRLMDLRRKAIEHKARHEGESGTLVVPTKQPILVLMRHGQSMWNELKLFTGDVDIPLTEKGVMEALSGGRTIKDVDFDIVFTSRLLRAKQTAMLALTQNTSHVVPVLVRGGYYGEGRIGDGNRLRLREAAMYALDKAACKMVPVFAHPALNERCYGDLQGLNKEAAAKEFGKELVQKWRRSNDTSPPGGESLVDTARRARKYYVEVIEPRLREGKNVLVVTHGNVMRGLIAHLASLEEEEMLTLEISTAFPYAYAFGRESGAYAQCCLMKPMEDFITGEPLEDKPMGLASVLKKKNFDSLI